MIIVIDSPFTHILVALVTLALTWLFTPALTAALARNLQWDETDHSPAINGNVKDKRPPVQVPVLSIVVPAYDEEDRIQRMLYDAHEFLESPTGKSVLKKLQVCASVLYSKAAEGVEWVVVDDGSNDDTSGVVKASFESFHSEDQLCLLALRTNSGKGAAVKIGMLKAAGIFRLMVDADGATEFGPGLQRLVDQLESALTTKAVPGSDLLALFGSRAHLQNIQNSQRSYIRLLLMRAFHFFVSLFVSSRIKDTQCGFKLFTKTAAMVAFNSLHLHRWAFDIELVLISDLEGIQIYEVDVPWREIDGSKLSTSKFSLLVVSLSMLRDMICVRVCYFAGIWKVVRQ